MKIKILFALNENVNGKATHFEAGEVVDLPDDDALRMIEALQAEAPDAKPKRGKKEDKWPEEQ